MSFGSRDGATRGCIDFRPTATAPGRGAIARPTDYVFPLRQTGAHWGLMSLAALLMLEALDVAAGRRRWRRWRRSSRWKAAGASARCALAGGAFTLIDESYNANPVSVAAALRDARRAAGRRGGASSS